MRRILEGMRKLDLPAEWGGASFPAALGSGMILLTALDPNDVHFPSGRGAAFTVGGLLLLLGVGLFLPSFLRGASRRPLLGAIGLILLLAFVGVPVALAWRRGVIPGMERRGPGSLPPTPEKPWAPGDAGPGGSPR